MDQCACRAGPDGGKLPHIDNDQASNKKQRQEEPGSAMNLLAAAAAAEVQA